MKTLLLILIAVLPVFKASTSAGAPAKIADQDLRNKIARDMIASFVKQDYDAVSASFNDNMKQALPKEKLQEAWQAVADGYGKYIETTSTSAAMAQGYNQVVLGLKFEKNNLTMEVTFNPDDKVIGLFFK